MIQMLRRQSGATVEDIIAKTGWQPHSVRGFFSGLVKKKLKLPLTSEVGQGRRAPLPHRADRVRQGVRPWRGLWRLARAALGGAGNPPPNPSKT